MFTYNWNKKDKDEGFKYMKGYEIWKYLIQKDEYIIEDYI